jgi:hypothetical protein
MAANGLSGHIGCEAPPQVFSIRFTPAHFLNTRACGTDCRCGCVWRCVGLPDWQIVVLLLLLLMRAVGLAGGARYPLSGVLCWALLGRRTLYQADARSLRGGRQNRCQRGWLCVFVSGRPDHRCRRRGS